jgi:hypothetical protein
MLPRSFEGWIDQVELHMDLARPLLQLTVFAKLLSSSSSEKKFGNGQGCNMMYPDGMILRRG